MQDSTMKSIFFSGIFILPFFSSSISIAQSVLKTDSGLEYIHHRQNPGQKPQKGDWVYLKCEYGTEDITIQSWGKDDIPIEVQMFSENTNEPYLHLFEAISCMARTDSLTLLIPAETLQNYLSGIQANKIVKFDIVLLDIVKNEDKMAADLAKQNELDAKLMSVKDEAIPTLEAYTLNALGDKLITTASGLKYVVHQQGSGPRALPGQYVLVDYYGMLIDGTRFDDSYKNGYPFGFPLGRDQAIPGFDEALLTLPVGSRFTVFIPAHLAYGENGAPPVIPANAEIVFHLNFIKIESQD